MKHYIILLWTAMSVAYLMSCKDEDESSVSDEHVIRKIWLREMNDAGNEMNDGKLAFSSFSAYLFKDSILNKVYSDLTVDADGGFIMNVVRTPDTRLYFLTDAREIISGNYEVNATTEKDFLNTVTLSLESPEKVAAFATGKIDVSPGVSLIRTVALKRGIARLDVEISENGNQLESISIKDLACGSYLFPQSSVATPPSVKKGNLNLQYEQPLTGARAGICYLYEQQGGQEVTLVTRLDGRTYTLKGRLPEMIGRNHVYRIRITGRGATLQATVDTSEWEIGSDTGTTPDLRQKVKIDLDKSVLPDGVRVSASRDTVYVPYYGKEFQLALENADTDIQINGKGAVVTPATGAGDKEGMFQVKTAMQPPGGPENYIYLEVRNLLVPGIVRDRIVITVARSETRFSGIVNDYFKDTSNCALDEYRDGELGFVENAENNEITCVANWIRLEKTAAQGYKILAGYRPNDPEADGRIQTADIVVNRLDGEKEIYTISRPNTGLPVVLIRSGGVHTYWCKFNLKGNARSFDDQISLSHPAAQAADLYEYLKTCKDAEFMELMGDAYKGRNTTGLKLIYTGTGSSLYAYKDYSSTGIAGGSISEADPKAQCPPGYELPSTSDYEGFFTKGVLNLSATNSEVDYQTLKQEKAHLSWYRRENIAYDGHTIAGLDINEIKINSSQNATSPLVLFGTGTQSNNTDMAFTSILLASIDPGVSNLFYQWSCGSSISKAPQDNTKTRTIRCIKSKFGFIY